MYLKKLNNDKEKKEIKDYLPLKIIIYEFIRDIIE
jgi:hypothetical protein